MDIVKVTEEFTAEQTLQAAREHYLTGPRPNILQYPSDYAAVYYAQNDDDVAWYPVVYGTEKGYVAQVEESTGYVRHVGTFGRFPDAAFAAHDLAHDIWESYPDVDGLDGEDAE